MPPQTIVRTPRVSRQTRLTAVIVASALFMQNLDFDRHRHCAADHGALVRLRSGADERGADVVSAEPDRVHPGERLGGGPLWHADVFRWAIVVFTVGSILCGLSNGLVELVAGAHPARRRRRDDGAGRAAAAAADRGEVGAGGGDGVADHAGAAGPGGGTAGGRLHRHLLQLALDVLHQHPGRPDRAGRGHPVHPGFSRAAQGQVRCARPGADRPGAGLRDVRAGNRRPRPGGTGSDRGDDRRRRWRSASCITCTPAAPLRRCWISP